MAVTDSRQRSMPTMKDRETGQPLAYPEAVLLTDPINPAFRGEVPFLSLSLLLFLENIFSITKGLNFQSITSIVFR